MKSAAIRIFLIAFMAFPALILQTRLYSQDNTEMEEPPTEATSAGPGFGMKYIESQLQLDLDGDEFDTQDEWNRMFVKIDENGDKRLSAQEMQSALGDADEQANVNDGRLAAFTRLDRSGNGVIEFSEWPGMKRSFRYLDSNRDQLMSREEFMSRKAKWWNQVFENIDWDGDRILTRQEWMDSEASFDRLDRNHDGYIVRGEFYNPR